MTPPPDTIYIIRHGEKPAEPPPAPAGQAAAASSGPPFGVDFQGNQDPHSLLPRGWERSGALPASAAAAPGTARTGPG